MNETFTGPDSGEFNLSLLLDPAKKTLDKIRGQLISLGLSSANPVLVADCGRFYLAGERIEIWFSQNICPDVSGAITVVSFPNGEENESEPVRFFYRERSTRICSNGAPDALLDRKIVRPAPAQLHTLNTCLTIVETNLAEEVYQARLRTARS